MAGSAKSGAEAKARHPDLGTIGLLIFARPVPVLKPPSVA
jgi:hypothetical protein